MNSADLIYLFFLVFSIGFGAYYRKLPNAQSKKTIGAIVGLLLVLVVSGLHALHILVTILGNAIIIIYLDKSYCHIVSFVFSFLYLMFFRTTIYFGIPYPPGYTEVIQMILTLKLIGLAFDVNSASISNKSKADFRQNNEESAKAELNDVKLEFLDIFYYGLNYIGVLTGPFYKYQTYYDHLHKPFNKYDDFKAATLHRIFPLVPALAAIFLFSDYMWPLSYITTDDFNERSFLYRYFYMWPTFLNFRTRLYIGFILSECICIMGGLGVYPSFVKSRPGNGPTENFVKLKEVCNDESCLKDIKYDYNTVYLINVYAVECFPTTREGMRDWNMPVQYWLASCIYKRFPSKKFRALATMLVSGVWHGVYSGYYICALIVLFVIAVEDIWTKLLLKDEYLLPRKVSNIILPILKMQFFSYAGMGFCLLEVNKIMHYYNSVYHWLIIMYIILFFIGRKLLSMKKQNMNMNGINSKPQNGVAEDAKIK